MKHFYVYCESGAILYNGVLSKNDSINSIVIYEPNTWVAWGMADPAKHYVVNHQLLSLTDEQQKIYNSRPWMRRDFDFSKMEYPDPRTDEEILAEAKLQQWEQIKQGRRAAEFSSITVDGATFDADAESQQKISSAIQLGGLPESPGLINWTLSDNSVIELSYQQLLQVGISIAQRTNHIYSKARQLRNLIEQAATLEDVKTISFNDNR